MLLNDLSHMMSPATRRAYINASHTHRNLATSHGSGTQRLALLPLRTAPRGRPLHADEVVPVVWTIRDEGTSCATTQTARRRSQIQGLVNEAAAQGAMATVEAIAQALVVAPRTIQRDLHELRRQGIVIDTRGTLAS